MTFKLVTEQIEVVPSEAWGPIHKTILRQTYEKLRKKCDLAKS